MTRALRDIIPSPDTRAWLRELYRVNPALAGEVAWAIHEGVLIDMGTEDFYPCPEHPGVNVANRPCYRCGKDKPEQEASWKYADRGWHGQEQTQEASYNPAQLNLQGEVQGVLL